MKQGILFSMRLLKVLTSLLLAMVLLVLCQQILFNSLDFQHTKIEQAEVNHIKYGLLSVDQWKVRIEKIIIQEINRLRLTKTNEKELKAHVEVQLDKLIDKVAEKVKEKNQGSFKGWLKQSFINSFVDMGDIKSGIPQYADQVVAEMTKEQAEQKLKSAVKERVENYLEKTFERQDKSALNLLLEKYETNDIEIVKVKMEEKTKKLQEELRWQTWALIGLSVLIFLIAGFPRKPLSSPQFIILSVTLITLLLAGVMIPMIDLEAKISKMIIFLMNHPIMFENQVLYFQSKSILDVFWIMITHETYQMKFVGVLLVMFSVVFPLVKLFSSMLFYYNFRNCRENSLVQFFVLKSGKWSMTDVMVVAIFMAYIGFNGVLTSQFAKLNSNDEEMMFIATNGTSLQPGFYIFFTYTMLALFLSGFLTRKTTANCDTAQK